MNNLRDDSILTGPCNRCNLPPALIASLDYQRQPIPIELDGVKLHYRDLFLRLDQLTTAQQRASCFADYMAVHFRLPGHELAPWAEAEPVPRPQANYRRLLLGWLFDSDSDAGAAWRLWVESRFGLRTLYHKEPIPTADSGPYFRFMQAGVRATYNTNDLASQLDLLYSYCQYELAQRHPGHSHLSLYRGGHEQADIAADGSLQLQFNNLSSFTQQQDEAYRFGSCIYAVQVPLTKIVCFDALLPTTLGGEREYMVLGGRYRVERVK